MASKAVTKLGELFLMVYLWHHVGASWWVLGVTCLVCLLLAMSLEMAVQLGKRIEADKKRGRRVRYGIGRTGEES